MKFVTGILDGMIFFMCLSLNDIESFEDSSSRQIWLICLSFHETQRKLELSGKS